ncbi:MAG: hypothetical protein ABI175_16755 [Polyangiales bacterium]
MSRTAATKLVTIVEAMSRERALPLGPERAYAVTQLVARTAGKTTVAEVVDRGFDLDGETINVHQLSSRQIEKIARRLRAAPAPKPREREAINTARRLQAALRALGLEDAMVRTFRRRATWQLQVELPAGVADPLMAALRDTRPARGSAA